jgi:hypothetical protein
VTCHAEEIETNDWASLYLPAVGGDYLCIVSKSKQLSASSLDASIAGLGEFSFSVQGLDILEASFLMVS